MPIALEFFLLYPSSFALASSALDAWYVFFPSYLNQSWFVPQEQHPSSLSSAAAAFNAFFLSA
jgi:hypothetical protein